ncbi:MAG: thioredoxin-disulfide reductase [Desulfococcaceae bacterium]
MSVIDHDLIIIGGGPAGLTAALYAARARLDVLVLEKSLLGGQVLITDWIDNYPGFPEGIAGPELSRRMADQVARYDVPIVAEEVVSADLGGPVKRLRLPEREICARAVIVASGASPRQLGVPGESDFFGKGISTCATCDGPFYRGKTVAAVGGGDTAVKESVFLAKFAEKVYLIHRRDQFRAERVLQEKAFANDRIEILWDSVVTGVSGLTRAESVHLRNLRTGESRSLNVAGLFIWIGVRPNTGFLGNQLENDPFGFLSVDSRMAASLPGVFAAGDVRVTPMRQIATAVGDAAIAAHAAQTYLENLSDS